MCVGERRRWPQSTTVRTEGIDVTQRPLYGVLVIGELRMKPILARWRPDSPSGNRRLPKPPQEKLSPPDGAHTSLNAGAIQLKPPRLEQHKRIADIRSG